MRLFLSMPLQTFTFMNGLTAQALQVQDRGDLVSGLGQLGLQNSRPVMVIVGGASNLDPTDYERLEKLFTDLLAPLAEELGLVAVDGGTDAGIMRLMGRARSKINGTFPLIGVAPLGKVQLPDSEVLLSTHSLEPHHTHFVLVPGERWGDESSWMAEIASCLAKDAPSMTILINGGSTTSRDARESIAEQRLVVVISGTGRLADRIAKAAQNPQTAEQETWLIQSGYFRLFDIADEDELKAFLRQYFAQEAAT